MKKILACVVVVAALALCGCASTQGSTGTASSAVASAASTASTASSTAAQFEIPHRYASASEGKDLLFSNEKYYAGFSQNDLDFRMQKTGATMEEYKALASEQVREFTDEENSLIDGHLEKMATTIRERGYTLPPLDEVVFVKTTMAEECNVSGYTHGTTIFLSANMLAKRAAPNGDSAHSAYLTETLWHELFHCLTRNNPDFRADMYKLVHFTVHDTDYTLPPSVVEYHISNPDVEHHDSSAVFRINGKDVECFADFITTRHFEKEGDSFVGLHSTALVPVDGSDLYYTPDQAENFYEVFGRNTEYVIDPEECMADNFSYALTYGTEGKDGNGYESPEIIEGVIAYLSH